MHAGRPLAFLLALTAAVLLASCAAADRSTISTASTPASPEITVSGTVSTRRGDHALVVGSSSGQNILVVTIDPVPPVVEPGARVSASGRVRVFEPDALASEFHLAFDAATFADWRGTDCLVSTTVSLDG